MRRAQDLVRKFGTRARVVVPVEDLPAQRVAGRRMAAMLDRLGYPASLRVLPTDDFFARIEGATRLERRIPRQGDGSADYPHGVRPRR